MARHLRVRVGVGAVPVDPYVVFDVIYGGGGWSGQGSGPGSCDVFTLPYREWLVDFIRVNGVRSVLDVGCGDFRVMRGVVPFLECYVGLDVAGVMLERNRRDFPGLDFRVGNVLCVDLPVLDCVVLKDVLQHLPDRDVGLVLGRLVGFKFVVLVNDVRRRRRRDVVVGGYRGVDVVGDFGFRGVELFRWGGKVVVVGGWGVHE